MKDYFKYLTVGEITDQIRDTFTSAKQKLSRITNPIISSPSFVNQKFYNYVSQIKNKQLKYDSLMNQSTQLNALLNQRRKRINESLEKYERNKKCKTLGSFNDHLYMTASSFQQSSQNYHSNNRFDNIAIVSESKDKVSSKKLNEKYQTQPRQEVGNIKEKIQIFKENKVVQKRQQKRHTQHLEVNKDSESKRLRSITKVINIRIDNNLQNQKLFSFAKNTIKSQLKQNPSINTEQAKKKIRFQTTPSVQTLEKEKPPKPQNLVKQKKATHKLLNVEQKSLKRIRERLKDNESKVLRQFQKEKKQQCTKMLLLKFEYQSLLKNDLKVKLISAKDTHTKLMQHKLLYK